MIVVLPPSVRREEGHRPTSYEEHLLERVSILELRLSQMIRQVGMAYDFTRREANCFEEDHIAILAFLQSLKKVNPELSAIICREMLEIQDKKIEDLNAKNSRGSDLDKIVSAHGAEQSELFTHLVKDGIVLLELNEEKQAIRTLERAILLSPKNIPLIVFVTRHLLKFDRFDEARACCEKAFRHTAQDPAVLLLFGTLYGDMGQSETARGLLSSLLNFSKPGICISLIWGFLAAKEENWSEALAAFKEALGYEESAEVLYLIACTLKKLGKINESLDFLERCISLDKQFADAWFMKSLVLEEKGLGEPAAKAMEIAFQIKEPGAQCHQFLHGRETFDSRTVLPFQHLENPEKRVLSGGSRRLYLFLRERILEAADQ